MRIKREGWVEDDARKHRVRKKKYWRGKKNSWSSKYTTSREIHLQMMMVMMLIDASIQSWCYACSLKIRFGPSFFLSSSYWCYLKQIHRFSFSPSKRPPSLESVLKKKHAKIPIFIPLILLSPSFSHSSVRVIIPWDESRSSLHRQQSLWIGEKKEIIGGESRLDPDDDDDDRWMREKKRETRRIRGEKGWSSRVIMISIEEKRRRCGGDEKYFFSSSYNSFFFFFSPFIRLSFSPILLFSSYSSLKSFGNTYWTFFCMIVLFWAQSPLSSPLMLNRFSSRSTSTLSSSFSSVMIPGYTWSPLFSLFGKNHFLIFLIIITIFCFPLLIFSFSYSALIISSPHHHLFDIPFFYDDFSQSIKREEG